MASALRVEKDYVSFEGLQSYVSHIENKEFRALVNKTIKQYSATIGQYAPYVFEKRIESNRQEESLSKNIQYRFHPESELYTNLISVTSYERVDDALCGESEILRPLETPTKNSWSSWLLQKLWLVVCKIFGVFVDLFCRLRDAI